MATSWFEIVKVNSEGKCYLMSYCTHPPTRKWFVHGVHFLARFQQMLARNEEAALVCAMADEEIPIFEGVNSHQVANDVWNNKIKYASHLRMIGWDIPGEPHPLLWFRDGLWMGDAQVEAANLILKALARALFTKPEILGPKMILEAEQFWDITVHSNLPNESPENSIQLIQWPVEETDACAIVEVPAYISPHPVPMRGTVRLGWKVRDAVLHRNGCTASMGFRTAKGYFGIMVQYEGSIFQPGWCPEYLVCSSNLDHIPWDSSVVQPKWESVRVDTPKPYLFPVDKVGFKITISIITVASPAFRLWVNITPAPLTTNA